jgi:hypothetical protein
VILRILGEGQYLVDDTHTEELNRLDDEVLRALEAGDAQGYARALGQLLQAVRKWGSPLPAEEILPSDGILPHEGISLEEARRLLEGETEEGFVPGRPGER